MLEQFIDLAVVLADVRGAAVDACMVHHRMAELAGVDAELFGDGVKLHEDSFPYQVKQTVYFVISRRTLAAKAATSLASTP